MSVKIYVPGSDGPIQVGTFKDQKAAETYWERARDLYRDKYGYLPEPIYVETGGSKRKCRKI